MNESVLRPAKAIFSPTEDPVFEIDFPRNGMTPAVLEVTHLSRRVGEWVLDSPPGDGGFTLPLPPEERVPGRGFGLVLRDSRGRPAASSAFDLSDPENPPFRYGFVCDFRREDREKSGEVVEFFRDFHLTHAQYYDWVYRHHDYRPPEKNYRDLMGKEIDRGVLKALQDGCRTAGIKNLGYGAVYAAGEEYWREHRECGLDDFRGNPHRLIDTFYIMDIRKSSSWTQNIREQYRYAVEEGGFDGLHMDTYGYPKRAWCRGEPVFLEQEFPRFIGEVRKDLPGAVLLFNNVGNWPVSATAPAPQDGVYIEVWEPHDHYRHIRQILLDAAGYGKPVIIAAYLAPFRLEENREEQRPLTAARYLTAAVAAHGGYHLLLGERGAALTQGYYNDYSLLTGEQRRVLKGYYDFLVRYGEILHDPGLTDVSETHTAGENREYRFSGAPTSPDGRAGTVWTVVRENRRRKVLSFINLLDQDESEWNRGKTPPVTAAEVAVEIPLDGEVGGLFFASPDLSAGEALPLAWTETAGFRGAALEVRLPPCPSGGSWWWSLPFRKNRVDSCIMGNRSTSRNRRLFNGSFLTPRGMVAGVMVVREGIIDYLGPAEGAPGEGS